MSALRREVEPPRRPHERVSFYLGAASLLFSLLIVVDAARWPGAVADSRQATVERERAATAARLRASRCRAARQAEARAAAREAEVARVRAELDREDVHGQLMRQLDRAPAVLDDFDPTGRYGKMNHTDPDAVRRHEKAIERTRRATRSNRHRPSAAPK